MRDINYANVAASTRSSDRSSRPTSSAPVLTWKKQYVFDFILFYSMGIDVRLAGVRINEEAHRYSR